MAYIDTKLMEAVFESAGTELDDEQKKGLQLVYKLCEVRADEVIKHGRWTRRVVPNTDAWFPWICSACGEGRQWCEEYPTTKGFNFCHHCGARMDGEP